MAADADDTTLLPAELKQLQELKQWQGLSKDKRAEAAKKLAAVISELKKTED